MILVQVYWTLGACCPALYKTFRQLSNDWIRMDLVAWPSDESLCHTGTKFTQSYGAMSALLGT